MKILVFEARRDELNYLEKYAEEYGLDITVTDKLLTPETVSLTKGFDGATVLGHSQINRSILLKLKEYGVRKLSTRTVGMNHIDTIAAEEAGITVRNSTYGADCVAEFTIMLMLMSLRKYKAAMFRGNVNDYSLEGLNGRELRSCTAGVIGTGAIGTAVIKLLHGFGAKVLAYSPTGNIKREIEQIATYTDADTLYALSDIITLHIPLLPGTENMIDKTAISKMKDGVTLINCARGELMHIPSVIEGVEKEKIGALAMDVFDTENNIYHHDRRLDIISNRDMAYLRQFPNVVMTQHMAFYTDNSVASMVRNGLASFL